jgi:hypothetical protein
MIGIADCTHDFVRSRSADLLRRLRCSRQAVALVYLYSESDGHRLEQCPRMNYKQLRETEALNPVERFKTECKMSFASS